MKKSPAWWKVALIGCGVLVGGGLLAVASAVGLMVWSSRAVLQDFDALARRTTPGMPLDALLDDPFVARCADVSVRGPFEASAERLTDATGPDALLQRLRTAGGKGTVELMWVHTPPFGRVFLAVDFEDGKVTGTKTSSLD